MKKMNKKDKREIIIVISSFFIGCIVTMLVGSLVLPLFIKSKETIYEKNSLAPSINKIQDAVVTIESYNGTAILSTGSGFVYKTSGKKAYILTNEHVIEGNNIIVINEKDEETTGKVLGKDEYLDLAVIEIDKKYALKVATLGESEKTSIGDTIFVIGSPVSKRYHGSISTGILSGKDRIVQTLVEEENTSEWLMRVLQFDASVNPGNSGGPLLNMNGEVIGICTMKLIREDIEGMAFAIPIEYALKNVEDLEKGKELEWPEIGISMVNVTSTAQLLNNNIEVPEYLIYGAVVLSTKENSSASKILKKGDIIIEMDGVKIKDTSYIKYVLFQHKVGDKIKVKILRNNKEKEVEITLRKTS